MRFFLFILSLLAVSTGCVTAPKTAPVAALCTTDTDCMALCERMGGESCEHP